MTAATQSPFDAIKQTREDGSEFWSARDLMEVMGYTKWQNFTNAVSRTSKVLNNNGVFTEDHVKPSFTEVEIGCGAVREVTDFNVSMFFLTTLAMFCGGDSTSQIEAAKVSLAAAISGAHVVVAAPRAEGNDGVRGCVYVVEGSNGYTKVGRSVTPESRVHKHRSYLKTIGATVTRTYVSGEFMDSRNIEREVIRMCAAKGHLVGNTSEWFTGVPFEYAVACVEDMSA